LFFALLANCGCSALGSRYQSITVASVPPGASVILSDREVGRAPITLEVHRNRNPIIEVRKSGYDTALLVLSSYKPSTLALLDMTGASLVLIPFVGLLSDAAWSYDPASFAVHLSRKEPNRE